MEIIYHFLAVLVVIATQYGQSEGHGRLLEPPSRSSMWRSIKQGVREFPNAPVNYNDNQLFCGGRINYIYQHKRCGICGDPFQGPRNNEAGGYYATGQIVRHYTSGQVIDITVEITANHHGFFEFRLCPNNNPQKAATQECLDQHVLTIINGDNTRYYLGGRRGIIKLKAKLPEGLTCTQCVMQWRWKTGNSYGYSENGTYCLGCGLQEMFLGCADVSVSNGNAPSVHIPSGPVTITPKPSAHAPVQTSKPNTGTFVQQPGVFVPFRPPTQKPYFNQNGQHNTQQAGQTVGQVIGQTIGQSVRRCHGINLWAGVQQLDQWCVDNCRKGNCPANACHCD